MIEKIKYQVILKLAGRKSLDVLEYFSIVISKENDTLNLRFKAIKTFEVESLTVDFHFNCNIEYWRGSDNTWLKTDSQALTSNYFIPKILKLRNGLIIAGQYSKGAWVFEPKKRERLSWVFYHPDLTPTLFMNDQNIREFRKTQVIISGTEINCGLIIGDKSIEEFSRAPNGFLPIICFTDHADFDNLAVLSKQRKFFRECGIRVTKSFFLFHHVKTLIPSSLENLAEKEEYLEWEKEGHELCYHALSHSCPDNWQEEFESFKSPSGLFTIRCYIDHATLPYNYSKTKDLVKWYKHMSSKNIQLAWSYVDSGDGNFFTLNQLDATAFTVKKIMKSYNQTKKEGYSRKYKDNIRNILLYYVDEKLTSYFLKLKLYPVRIFGRKEFKLIPKLIKTIICILSAYLFNPKFYYRFFKYYSTPFNFAKFTPVCFDGINQQETKIRIFQSIALRDFDITLSDKAIHHFISAKGLCIAHTYFATLRPYHYGRMYLDNNYEMRPESEKVFRNLGNLIKSEKIWNPTVSELDKQFRLLEKIEYVKNNDGNIVIKQANKLEILYKKFIH